VVVSLPVGVAQSVHLAHQQGWIANLWIGLGSLASMIAVIVAASHHADLAVLVLAMLGGPPVAYLGSTVTLFAFTRPDLRPRLRMVTSSTSRRVLRNGASFFVLATAGAVGYQSDTLVISHFIGADAVADYTVPFRLFMLAPTLVALVVTPLWPAYGEAVARGDLDWVRRTFRRSIVVSLVLTVVPTIILIPVAQPIIDRWIGPEVTPPIGLIVGIGAWAVVNAVSLALAMLFNGCGVLRFQVVVATAMAVSNLVLSIVLVQGIGIEGPIIATVGTQILCVLLPSWMIMRNLFAADAPPERFSEWVSRWGTRVQHTRSSI
jgi:O-antigen/teichoic acid export membrane protein